MARHPFVTYSLARDAVDAYWALLLPLLKLAVPEAPGLNQEERRRVYRARWAIMAEDPEYQRLIKARDDAKQTMYDEAMARIAANKANCHP